MLSFFIGYLIFFICFIIIMAIQNTYEEYARKKNHHNYLKSKLQYIPCPTCFCKWEDHTVLLEGEFKIYLKCDKCEREWTTTVR